MCSISPALTPPTFVPPAWLLPGPLHHSSADLPPSLPPPYPLPYTTITPGPYPLSPPFPPYPSLPSSYTNNPPQNTLLKQNAHMEQNALPVPVLQYWNVQPGSSLASPACCYPGQDAFSPETLGTPRPGASKHGPRPWTMDQEQSKRNQERG